MRLHLFVATIVLSGAAVMAEDLDPLGQKLSSLGDENLTVLLKDTVDGEVTRVSVARAGGKRGKALFGFAEIKPSDGSEMKVVRFSKAGNDWSIESVEILSAAVAGWDKAWGYAE